VIFDYLILEPWLIENMKTLLVTENSLFFTEMVFIHLLTIYVEDEYFTTLEEQEEQQNKPHYEIQLLVQLKLHLIFLLVIATLVADNVK
jgi:hypothetical protein